MYLRTTSHELAGWLEQAGGAWHVEGETTLAASLPMPSPASSLVEALRKRSVELAVLAPDAGELEARAHDAPLSARELSSAAHVIEGQRVFQLAWVGPDGEPLDAWLLAEVQQHAGRVGDGAAARKLMASLRPTAPPRR